MSKNPIDQKVDSLVTEAIQKKVNEEALVEWAGKKEESKVIPPLPFKKPKRHYLSILLP